MPRRNCELEFSRVLLVNKTQLLAAVIIPLAILANAFRTRRNRGFYKLVVAFVLFRKKKEKKKMISRKVKRKRRKKREHTGEKFSPVGGDIRAKTSEREEEIVSRQFDHEFTVKFIPASFIRRHREKPLNFSLFFVTTAISHSPLRTRRPQVVAARPNCSRFSSRSNTEHRGTRIDSPDGE